MARVAWIGLGLMGRPMSKHLIDAGQDYWFRHRCHGAGSRPRHGVDVKDSIADAVRDADAVFTILPAGTNVDDVMTCADGVFASIHSGTLVVDCSTIGIDYARKLHSATEKVGAPSSRPRCRAARKARSPARLPS